MRSAAAFNRIMVSFEKIYQATNVLKSVVRPTNIIPAPALSSEANIYLKPENLQVTGSFKVRGSAFKISQLTEEEKAHGVIACSAGNHAQGVALAASKCGIRSIICLPDSAPISKVEATKAYGAEVIMVAGTYDDAYKETLRLRDEGGYTLIHPFDDEYVIAGQGTIGVEILNDFPEVEAIVVPVGGGGLISGVACAVKTLRPDVKVFGVQAEGAPSMLNSLNAGKIETLSSVHTIADGIAVKQPGVNTFELCSKYVDKIISVSEDEIAHAILTLMEKHKMVAEGAGAVSVAAAMSGKLPIKGLNTVCIVSGGNIDVTILSRVINRGLLKSGRLCRLSVRLVDKPGQLRDVSRIISDEGANVIAVLHERSDKGEVNDCILSLDLETRNFEHIEQVKRSLTSNGFILV